MDLNLKGKVAVVTGGSLGIGRAVTEALAREGVRVAIVARSKGALEEAAREISEATGVEILAAPADVSKTDQVQAMMDMVAKHFGRIDILVNGAAHPGGLVRSEIENADPEGLLEDINIKVVGYMRCAKAAAAHMKANGFGRIINFSSVAAPMDLEGEAVYAASKSAVEGFTRAMRRAELEDSDVRWSSVPRPRRVDRLVRRSIGGAVVTSAAVFAGVAFAVASFHGLGLGHESDVPRALPALVIDVSGADTSMETQRFLRGLRDASLIRTLGGPQRPTPERPGLQAG